MHNTSTLLCSFLRSSIPSDSKVLPPRLSLEVNITVVDNFNEIKYRLCEDGSRMTEGVDFENSFVSTTDVDVLRIIISRVALRNIWVDFYDVSNIFQTNVIEDPSKRHYSNLPPIHK